MAIGARSQAATPLVLQSVLQQLGIRAHLYRFYNPQQVTDFFARKGVPEECRFTILCAHAGGPAGDPAIHYDLVEQKDGDNTDPYGWEDYDLEISESTIPDLVTKARGTLVAMGCGAGREPLARAFLEAGYDGYVGATEEYVDGDSAFVFTVNLFYHLMAEERDFAPKSHTVAEAVELAALTDPDFAEGTRPYRYWGRKDFGLSPVRARAGADQQTKTGVGRAKKEA